MLAICEVLQCSDSLVADFVQYQRHASKDKEDFAASAIETGGVKPVTCNGCKSSLIWHLLPFLGSS